MIKIHRLITVDLLVTSNKTNCLLLKLTPFDQDPCDDEKSKESNTISINIDKIDEIEISNDFYNKLIINYEDTNSYEITSCSVIIIQIVLDLIKNIDKSKDNDNNKNKNVRYNKNLRCMLNQISLQINSEITENLSDIIDNIKQILFVDKMEFDDSDCCQYVENIKKLNKYLISLYIKTMNTATNKEENNSALIYMIDNLTKDINNLCIDFASNLYLKISSNLDFINKISPSLFNLLQSSFYIKSQYNLGMNQTVDFKNKIQKIVENAFKSIIGKIKQNQSRDINDDIECINLIIESLNNHTNIFMKSVDEHLYFKDDQLFEKINNEIIKILLKPSTEFIGTIAELNKNIPEEKQKEKEKYDEFIYKSRKIFSWFIINCKNNEKLKIKIEKCEAKCFELFISSEVHNLSNKWDEIGEAINLEEKEMNDLKECCYDKDENCYYGTSIIYVINILDPIMGKLNKLPMQQHHILQLAEFFTSTAAHFVISISTEINNINTFVINSKKSSLSSSSSKRSNSNPKLIIPDKLFILIGTLHKFDIILKQYLKNINILQKYKDSKYRSRSSSLIKNQNKETINNKLECITIFSLISTTLEETSKKLANDICVKLLINQRLIGIIWKRPINEAYSNDELEKFIQKFIWNEIIPFIKIIQKQSSLIFFNDFCFEIHLKMLNYIKSLIIPITTNDVLTFVQILRVKYTFNSIIKYMIKCWNLSEKEIYETKEISIINKMIQLSLCDIQTLRQTLNQTDNTEIQNAIKIILETRANNLRTVSGGNLFRFR